MLIIFIYLTNALGLNFSLHINNETQEVDVLMNAFQQAYFEQFEDFGKVLSIKFTGNNISNSFCKPYYQGVQITSSPQGLIPLVAEQVKKDLDDLTESDLYFGFNEKLISIAKSPEGICILSSKGKVYLIEFEASNNIHINNQTLPIFNISSELETLVYDEKTRNFFAFFQDHLIKFSFYKEYLNSTIVSQWKTPQKYFKIVASNGWIYSAQGDQGLYIYEILHDGIQLVKIITSEDIYNTTENSCLINDVVVEEDRLYILDSKNGISLFYLYFNGTFTKNEQFGIIHLQDCHSISVKDKTLIVIQNFKQGSQVIEYYIKEYEWLEIRRYFTKSKLQKADIIDDNLVIVRGLHDHKILLTRMASQYLDNQNHQLENYFFNGNLLGIQQVGDSNDTLFAVSPHGFYFFNYQYYPTSIICNSNDAKSGSYSSQMILQSTNCFNKTEKQNDLLYCQTNFIYNFEIKRPLMSAELQQNYFYISIVLGVIILILLYAIGYYYQRYKQKLLILQEAIKKKKENLANQLR